MNQRLFLVLLVSTLLCAVEKQDSPKTIGVHETYMRSAIKMAGQSGTYPFGAVIVSKKSGKIVSWGKNASKQNPLMHAEIDAINRLAKMHKKIDWRGLSLYTTAEPCPMCQAAIEWAGISEVYYGSSIPFLISQHWWQIDIRAEYISEKTSFRKTKVVGGVLEKECNRLYQRH